MFHPSVVILFVTLFCLHMKYASVCTKMKHSVTRQVVCAYIFIVIMKAR